MNRKEFFKQLGFTAIVLPACLGSLSGCAGDPFPSAPSNVDFTIDISTGALSHNGGYLTKSGVLVARTLTGNFLAVSSYCTHQGTTVQYEASQNDFFCPSHGAMYSATGKVTQGPASQSLKQYKTSLSGNSLRIFS